jgi:nitroreductase
LEKLVETCRYAPTGGNRQPVHIKIIQDRDKIGRLSSFAIEAFVRLIRDIEKQIKDFQSQGKPVPEALSTADTNLARYKTLPLAKAAGLDPILYKAPAVMLFHAHAQGASVKDDCMIAAHTATLGAMTMGLGSCYIGLFTMAARGNAAIMQELQLPNGHEVYATLVVGYPRLRFLRTVYRNPIPVSWD